MRKENIMNCNMNIFEFIKLDDDPIYNLLSTLKENSAVEIEGFTIRKEKFYEVENEEMHIGFKDLQSCYQFISHSVVAYAQ